MPAVLAWGSLGLLVNLVPLHQAALIVVIVYGTCYGLLEATGRPGLPAPSRTWQVPAAWVDHVPRWRRTAVWGALLGPGLFTRNPYAGFWLLPLIAASVGSIRVGVAFAAIAGVLHSTGRALALLRDVRQIESANYLQSVFKTLRWRKFDGLALLAAVGIAVTWLIPFATS